MSILLALGQLQAASLFIKNHSFENFTPTDVYIGDDENGDPLYESVEASDNWIYINTLPVSTLNNTNPPSTTPAGAILTGSVLGERYVNLTTSTVTDGIYEEDGTTLALFEAGTYNITVGISQRLDFVDKFGEGADVGILVRVYTGPTFEPVEVGTFSVNPNNDSQMVDYVFSFDIPADSEFIGQAFNIGLTPQTGETQFDNVRVELVPEPSAAMLGGVAGLVMLRRRRSA